MSVIEQTRAKVQRILTKELGSVRVDQDDSFIVVHESAVLFIDVVEGFKDGTIISFRVPLIRDVPITDELCRWIATEGQRFMLGGCYLNPNKETNTGWVYLKYSIIGDDLDESELIHSTFAMAYASDRLDNELQEKFGGELFGRE